MVDKYYNSRKFNNIIKFFIEKFPTPFDFFLSLGQFFNKKGYFARSISNTEYYKVFLEFNEEVLISNNLLELQDIIKFDYLRFNKKRGIPDFIVKKISKEEESQIKTMFRDNLKANDIYIEKFSIDIMNFVINNEIKYKDTYIIFDLKNTDNIIDILHLV